MSGVEALHSAWYKFASWSKNWDRISSIPFWTTSRTGPFLLVQTVSSYHRNLPGSLSDLFHLASLTTSTGYSIMMLLWGQSGRWRGSFPKLNLVLILWLFLAVGEPRVIKTPSQNADAVTIEVSNQFQDGRFAKRANRSPPVSQVLQVCLNSGIMPGKTSVFFSGFNEPDGYLAAREFCTLLPGCNTIRYNQCIPQAYYEQLNTVDNINNPPTTEQYVEKIKVLSTVFAKASTGNVYVLMPDRVDPSPYSIWVKYELPSLTGPGSGVKNIYVVRWPAFKTDGSPWKGQVFHLWKEGDGQQGLYPPAEADRSIFDV
jgi:hypothetical protein